MIKEDFKGPIPQLIPKYGKNNTTVSVSLSHCIFFNVKEPFLCENVTFIGL